ncbi:uncharacterized protein RAG0_08086 [Rhynchosporium agropyri]|uniref:Uncharacterized protein n=1 Tax=Rhynchosporium agropyri TaxID=914238 RepID=A0A1E1KP14_9HELO|nr:uncharacterized protein RAG0_08086 [Rhynchosporium agropyri]
MLWLFSWSGLDWAGLGWAGLGWAGLDKFRDSKYLKVEGRVRCTCQPTNQPVESDIQTAATAMVKVARDHYVRSMKKDRQVAPTVAGRYRYCTAPYLLTRTYLPMHAPPERPPNACQRDVMAFIGYTADFQIVVTEFSFDVSPTGAPLRALFIA